MPLTRHRDALDELYRRYTRREYVGHDPLTFLYGCDDPADREVVAFIASSLAYGRVAQILRSVQTVLVALGPRPAQALRGAKRVDLAASLAGFRHRFTGGAELASILAGLGELLRRHGSLNACFLTHDRAGEETVAAAMGGFCAELASAAGLRRTYLAASPAHGSACKRMNLFLRWMVRRDAVDPGGWKGVSPRRLLVPLDTHMHRFASRLGATTRRAADLRTTLEITSAFRRIVPDDPVRYDFALTRLGILPREDVPAFLCAD